MRQRKKNILHSLTAFFVAVTVSIGSAGVVNAGVVYENKTSQTVTAGVTYEEYARMYESGWVDVFALRIDLTNPNVKLDILENASEFGVRETVSQLAQSGGSVAAVNADFFNMSTLSSSMGIVMRDGNMDEARNYYNSSGADYAGIYIDNLNKPYIDYFKISNIGFLTNGQAKIEIAAKNKVTDMKKPVYIDRLAMADTSQLDARFKDLYKIVVANGKIADISAGGAVKTVPEDGYVIVMNYQTAVDSLKNFAVGDEAAYFENGQFLGNPSLTKQNIKFGISGGGKILENGEYRDGGLIVEPGKRHPRTAAGINKDKTQLILVAIDGRSKNSMGATHYETYEIMKSLGCWDAFHLDGGGSTTLLARNEGKTGLTIQNTPSEGAQRKVANAIGVSSASAPGALTGLYVEADGVKGVCTTFAGNPVQLSVMGYDTNFNPLPAADATFSQSGGAGGSLNGSVFTPSYEGETVITAESGGVTGSVIVKALARPTEIRITPEAFSAAVGETVQLKAELINGDGYGIDITGLSSVWGVEGNVGVFDGQGKFRATANGVGSVYVSYGGLTGAASAACGSFVMNLVDFETVDNITYIQGENGAPGSAAYTSAVKHDGNNSLQVNYTFKEKTSKRQAATIDFRNMNVLITERPAAFAFWLTGDAAGSTVTAVFTDGDGNEQIFGFPNKMDNGDWKYYYGKFSDSVSLPLKLSRITVTSAENLPNPVAGKVYLDTLHVAYDYKPDPAIGLSSFYSDKMRASLKTPPQAGETEIAVFGPTAHLTSGFHKSIFDRAIAKIQQNSRIAVFAGYTAELPQMLTETLKWLDTYSVKDVTDARIITLASSKGGLRATNPAQWISIANDLNNSPHKNAIIVLNKDLWDNENGFGDDRERDALHKTLKEYGESTGANVLVVSGAGDATKVCVRDGIRYVTLNGLVSGSVSPVDYNLLRVRVSGNTMRYDLESLE